MNTSLVWRATKLEKPEERWTPCMLAYEQEDGILRILPAIVFWNDGWKALDIRRVPVGDRDKYDIIAEPDYWAEVPKVVAAR